MSVCTGDLKAGIGPAFQFRTLISLHIIRFESQVTDFTMMPSAHPHEALLPRAAPLIHPPPQSTASSSPKTKTKKNTIIPTTVKPITCYADLVALPFIPTKLNNLQLPKKEVEPRMSARRKPVKEFPSTYVPGEHDVVIDDAFRGPPYINAQFRELIRPLVPRYLASSQPARKAIVSSILRQVSSNGGYFIKTTSKRWLEVDLSVAERFTSDALHKSAVTATQVKRDEKIPVKSVLSVKFKRPRQVSLETCTNALDILSQVAAFDYSSEEEE